MTALAYVFGASLLAFVIGVRLRAVRRYNETIRKAMERRPPVYVERYEGAPPPPLTARQVAILKDRQHRINAREVYRERPYLN